jgi:hypothetical protein
MALSGGPGVSGVSGVHRSTGPPAQYFLKHRQIQHSVVLSTRYNNPPRGGLVERPQEVSFHAVSPGPRLVSEAM